MTTGVANAKEYDAAAESITLTLADERATLMIAGGKGASLARLAAAGLPVPDGFHVTTEAYRRFVAVNGLQEPLRAALSAVDSARPTTLEIVSEQIQALFRQASLPSDIAYELSQAYEELPGISPAVAVRSSATAEDLPELSFAGQQETYLNVQGIAALHEAVRHCWASLWTSRAIGYRERHGIDPEGLSLAVVVQLMVPAEAAGILFTANPVTGRHDQVVINAAWGLGEAIVGGQVTPDSLIVEKHNGRVVERRVADKQQMTVSTNGGTETRPVPEARRRQPVLDDEQVAELTRLGSRIEQLYGCPVDVEWTLAQGKLAIVQARPITALPEPEASTPTDWPLPASKGKYIRTSIIDFMPDPLSPLFGTLGLSAINAGLGRLTTKMARSESHMPDELILTINDYAYMTMSFSAREWLWMIVRLVPSFGRLVREGKSWWLDEARPRYVEVVSKWEDVQISNLAPSQIMTGVDEVLVVAVDHLGSLMAGTMGISAGSEALFSRIYDRLIRKPEEPWAPAYLMGYDSVPIQAEKSLYDLAQWTRDREDLAAWLLRTPSARIAAQMTTGVELAEVNPESWRLWQQRLYTHMKRYGHIIYDLDFAKPLPRDDPRAILETCKMYLRGKGTNPHERQRRLAAHREEAAQAVASRLRGIRRWLFTKSLSFAQSRAEVREDAIADIGLGYPVLRDLLRELGRRLVHAGAMRDADDLFWLHEDELREATADLELGRQPEAMFDRVSRRKAVWRAEKRVAPPPQLPPDAKYLGMSADSVIPTYEVDQGGSVLRGIGASPGQVTALACVLHGPEDFEIMEPGEVLVAGITTPAWTPLFAMASAVVTDVGGPLSHGSIVAREYGIPAVLGTGAATKRIRQGDMITVDGDAGLVHLPDNEAAPT